MKVKATRLSKTLKVRIKELNRIAEPGEVFEVTDARYTILAGKNRYGLAFVQPLNGDNPQTPVVTKTTETQTVKINPTNKLEIDVDTNQPEPEIILIEPGKEPVKLDKDMNPIGELNETTPTKKTRKSKTTEDVENTNSEGEVKPKKTRKRTAKPKVEKVENIVDEVIEENK